MMPSEWLWNNGSFLFVQIFMSAACRVLFIAGQNGGDYVEKIAFYSWQFSLSNSVIILFVSVLISVELGGITFRTTYLFY